MRRGWILLLVLPLIIAACIPRGVRVPQSPILRYLERRSGLITFVGTDGNIYTIDQSGNNQLAVTTDAQLEASEGPRLIYQFPTWSPDSQKLAFVGIQQGGEEAGRLSLYTASPDGSQLNEAFRSESELPFYLFWSPDSEWVSFLASRPTTNAMVLKVVDVDGGEAQLVDTGQPYYWDWSPESDRLLVHVGGAARGHIAFLTLGDVISEEGLELQPTLFQAPAWSPRGDQLLLAIDKGDEQGALVLTDHSGSVIEELIDFEGPIAFAWSHDGSRLAYIADAQLSQLGILGPLTVMGLDEPALRETTEETQVVAFFWSPDGKKIAYFVPFLFQPPTESDEEASVSEQPQLLQALYLMEVETGESQRLAVFRATNEFLQLLPFFDQYHHSVTIWSPDSSTLVLSGLDSNGQPVIWTIPASGDTGPRLLTEGLVAFWSWN